MNEHNRSIEANNTFKRMKPQDHHEDEDAGLDVGLRQNTISTRLKLVLLAETKERGRFAYLEAHSNVPAATWRTWWTRGAMPSGALLEAVAALWPHYAFWLITGRTDVRCGHDMPKLAPAARGYISNWPEEPTVREKGISSEYSKEYLKAIQQLDDAKPPTDVSQTIKTAALRMISTRRKDEIVENFSVKLAFE